IEGVGNRTREIDRQIREATEKGDDPGLIQEYGIIRKKVLIGQRLIEILGRIYPIRKDGTIETDIEIPELYEFVRRFETDRNRCDEIRNVLFPNSS
ncbi:MAG: hypothetical protein LUQ07_02330, partial [Methanospirillum sp.]|nr:hypothetical protein [Methanospirillum sp.]